MALSPRDKRSLMILGAVAGVAVLYLLFKMVTGGGEPEAQPSPTVGPLPTATPSVTPTETPRPTSPPISLAGDRDPFSIPPGLSPSPTGGEVSPTSTVSPTGTVSPTSPPPTSQPPTSPPPTGPPPTSPPPTSPPPPPPEQPGSHILIGGHDVTLVDVFGHGKKVQVEVDGTVWTVEVGATFDDNFKLVKTDGTCARFLYGDQSFDLCTDPQK